MKKIKQPCKICGKEVVWGTDGCPSITEKEYEIYKFSFMMFNNPTDRWIHWDCKEKKKSKSKL